MQSPFYLGHFQSVIPNDVTELAAQEIDKLWFDRHVLDESDLQIRWIHTSYGVSAMNIFPEGESDFQTLQNNAPQLTTILQNMNEASANRSTKIPLSTTISIIPPGLSISAHTDGAAALARIINIQSEGKFYIKDPSTEETHTLVTKPGDVHEFASSGREWHWARNIGDLSRKVIAFSL